MSTANDVYGGLAQVGQIKAQVGLGISVCLALSLCAWGGSVIASVSKDKHTANTNATLKSTSCPPSFNCPVVATYDVGGKMYTWSGTMQSPLPATVNVNYNPDKPDDVVQTKPSYKLGATLISCAICIIIFGYLSYYLTMQYKPLAAIEGANAAAGVARAFI
jgi:hypothetical protein